VLEINRLPKALRDGEPAQTAHRESPAVTVPQRPGLLRAVDRRRRQTAG
jgi:hypothetical protein